MATNRIYTIYSSKDLNDVPIQKIANYIRYSSDGTKLIVEWMDTPPDGTTIIDHETASSLMQTEEWSGLDGIVI